MLIHYINGKGSFAGAINYLFQQKKHKDSVVVAVGSLPDPGQCELGQMTKAERREWKKQLLTHFESQAMRSRSRKEPRGHFVVSFHPKDDALLFDSELMRRLGRNGKSLNVGLINKIIEGIIQQKGLSDTQYAVWAHFEKRHFHLHCLYNKVGNDGKKISEWNNWRRNVQIQSDITKRYGFFISDGKANTNIAALRGIEKLRYLCAHDAAEVLRTACSLDEFTHMMRDRGWSVVARGDEEFQQGRVVISKQDDDEEKANRFALPGGKIDRILRPQNLVAILSNNAVQQDKADEAWLDISEDEMIELQERINELSMMITAEDNARIRKKLEEIHDMDSRKKMVVSKKPQIIDSKNIKPITLSKRNKKHNSNGKS